jgi:hypothetical protein
MPPTRMEIWAFAWIFGFVVMGVTAVQFFMKGAVTAGVASVITALVWLAVAAFLLRHRFHRSPKRG